MAIVVMVSDIWYRRRRGRGRCHVGAGVVWLAGWLALVTNESSAGERRTRSVSCRHFRRTPHNSNDSQSEFDSKYHSPQKKDGPSSRCVSVFQVTSRSKSSQMPTNRTEVGFRSSRTPTPFLLPKGGDNGTTSGLVDPPFSGCTMAEDNPIWLAFSERPFKSPPCKFALYKLDLSSMMLLTRRRMDGLIPRKTKFLCPSVLLRLIGSENGSLLNTFPRTRNEQNIV
jgi:hypothetical protein